MKNETKEAAKLSELNAELDSDGMAATHMPGDRVIVFPVKMEATVIRQILHHDCGETFWGNLEVIFDDGLKGTCHGWQAKKVSNAKLCGGA